MNNDKLQELETTLLEFLMKLNNGLEFSRNDINLHYQHIQQYIEILNSINDFPFDMYDDNIYCFIKSERSTFDTYHIRDIVKTIIEYKTNKDYKSDIQEILKESTLPSRP